MINYCRRKILKKLGPTLDILLFKGQPGKTQNILQKKARPEPALARL